MKNNKDSHSTLTNKELVDVSKIAEDFLKTCRGFSEKKIKMSRCSNAIDIPLIIDETNEKILIRIEDTDKLSIFCQIKKDTKHKMYMGKEDASEYIQRVIDKELLDYLTYEKVGRRFYISVDRLDEYKKLLNNTTNAYDIHTNIKSKVETNHLYEFLDALNIRYYRANEIPGERATRILNDDVIILNEFYEKSDHINEIRKEESKYNRYLAETKPYRTDLNNKSNVDKYDKYVEHRLAIKKDDATMHIRIFKTIISKEKGSLEISTKSQLKMNIALLEFKADQEAYALFCNSLYKKSFKKSKVTIKRNMKVNIKEPYPIHKWHNLAQALFLQGTRTQTALFNRALEDRICAMIYFYCCFHFVAAFRQADIIAFSCIDLRTFYNLEYDELYFMLENNNFSDDMAKKIVDWAVLKYDAIYQKPQKNASVTNLTLRLDPGEEFKPVLGKLIVLCEIYRYRKNDRKMITSAVDSYINYNKLFAGLEMKILGSRFLNIPACKTYMQNIERHIDNNEILSGSYVAAIVRAHKINRKKASKVTMGYLKNEKTNDEITKLVTSTGAFSFIHREFVDKLNFGIKDELFIENSPVAILWAEALTNAVETQIYDAHEIYNIIFLRLNDKERVTYEIKKFFKKNYNPKEIDSMRCPEIAMPKGKCKSQGERCNCQHFLCGKILANILISAIKEEEVFNDKLGDYDKFRKGMFLGYLNMALELLIEELNYNHYI